MNAVILDQALPGDKKHFLSRCVCFPGAPVCKPIVLNFNEVYKKTIDTLERRGGQIKAKGSCIVVQDYTGLVPMFKLASTTIGLDDM